MDCRPLGSPVYRMSEARLLECRFPFPPPGDLPDPGIEHASPEMSGGFFIAKSPGKSMILLPLIKLSLVKGS